MSLHPNELLLARQRLDAFLASNRPSPRAWREIIDLLGVGLRASAWVLVRDGDAVYRSGASQDLEAAALTAPVGASKLGNQAVLVLGAAQYRLALEGNLSALRLFARAVSDHLSLWARAGQLAADNERLQKQVTEAVAEGQAGPSAATILQTVSHEMRTPLNAILGMTELARDIESPTEREFCLDRVTASAERLSEMVEAALDVARIQAGDLELHPERVELQSLVSDAVGAAAPLGLPTVPPPPVEVDPKRLRQVLGELIRNARRFAGKASRVSLDWREDGEFLVLQVNIDDNGPGIPEKSLEAVFKPFMRLNATLDEGAGLGLTIARAIARGMDGDIVLANLPEGGLRASVQVRLPRLAEKGALVLAVGPDTPQWHEITDAVIGCDALLITAATAPEALRKARRDAFDFVLINAHVGGVAPELVARVIGDAQPATCQIIAVGTVSDPSAFAANVGYSAEEVVAVIRPTSGESVG